MPMSAFSLRRRLCSAAVQPITLAALVERIPVLTPPVPMWKRESEEISDAMSDALNKARGRLARRPQRPRNYFSACILSAAPQPAAGAIFVLRVSAMTHGAS